MAARQVEAGFARDGWTTYDDSNLPWQVAVRVSYLDGAPKLTGLRLDPRPDREPGSAVVDSRSLRKLPLRRLLEVGLRTQALLLGEGDDMGPALGQLADLLEQRERPSLRETGSEEHLADVARVYRAAVASGKPPRKALVRRYGVHERTVDTWLRLARSHEPPLLEPVRRGQRRPGTGTVK